MPCRRVVAALVGLVGVLYTPLARADEPAPRRYVVAVELGLIDSPSHLTDTGPDWSTFAPPEYVGAVFDGRVLPHLHLDGQVGFNFVQGYTAGSSLRLAAEASRVTISAGAGPLVASGNWHGAAAPYADIDGSIIVHFDGPLVFIFRTGVAWALVSRGSPADISDGRDPYLVRGDRIAFARLGIGSSF